ncbi:anhydro-N-acetylmuramic acid kinase [Geojedonia litorea]|uniref:Anhydro-N-acetylmuramic acid kinase n=1 Tax=Geojedonia litorea TaxID=1268269 RepID=A0ABV9N1S1_9FLAO
MLKNKYSVLGLMSGTSLDGLDIIHVTLGYDGIWDFNIHAAETIPYQKDWKYQLANLTSKSKEELKDIDESFTNYLAEHINSFISKNAIADIDFISSHGHTALHQPSEGLTYQIGNLNHLATLTGHTVVCDFRVQDVQIGGQGAPLVPIGDHYLFSNYNYCLNLGGFANLSTNKSGIRIAYDICPVNIVLNHYVSQLGHDYDDKGKIAKEGTINSQMLEQLNALDFYQQSYPKSLGLEWVEMTIFPIIDSYKLSVQDILKTFVEHIADQISDETIGNNTCSVLVTGGGAYNDYLISRLQAKSQNQITIPSKTIIEFKEALIFSLLGVLKIRDEVNCLASVTGASRDHSSGIIFQP